MLPVSGLRVCQCPEGVCPDPRRGPVLVPGTMLGHGSGYLRRSKVRLVIEIYFIEPFNFVLQQTD